MIPKPFIQEVLARTDIVDIIQARVHLKKRGRNYLACCPFHQEKTPSFNVSQEKQFYYCFGCGAHGNAIGFLIAFDRLDFPDAIEQLAAQLGMEIPQDDKAKSAEADNTKSLYPLMEKINQHYQIELRQSSACIEYLKARGLNGKIAKKFELGFSIDSWDQLSRSFGKNNQAINELVLTGMQIRKDNGHTYDRFRNRIMFPIRDMRGRVIAFGGRTITNEQPKYLNSPETPIFHKSDHLYGLYEARHSRQKLERIIIVEGYMDVISLAQHGVDYAVATLGTATNPKHLQILLRYTKKIIFCFDGDRAGRNAAWKALTMNLGILRDGIEIQFLFLPETEDPDSLVRKIGKAAFEKKCDEATSLPDVFFAHLKETINTTTIAGKAHYSKEAMQYIQQMPSGIFQELLTQRLADELNLERSSLMSVGQSIAPTNPLKSSTKSNTTAEIAAALLLQEPSLALRSGDLSRFNDLKLVGMELFLRLASTLQKNPEMASGHLLNTLDDPDLQQQVSWLISRNMLLQNDAVEAEFIGALDRLEELGIEQTIQTLIEKAKVNELLDDEKQRLQNLLHQKMDRARSRKDEAVQ